MWRWIRLTVIGVCGVLIVAVSAGALYQWIATRKELATTPPPGRLVDIGGHRLHIWCTGEGAPPVILETGLGGSSADWGFVQPEVARFTQVCSYDRAGSGYSDPGPSPRTARRMARELTQLLDRSGISGPAVLVGASIGGFTARIVASEYGDRVSGLVLVDATHEDQEHEIPQLARFVPFLSSVGVLRLLGMSFGLPPASLAPSVREFARATSFRAAGYQAAADEIVHVRESAAEVRATRRKLTTPVIVVTAGRGTGAEWLELQRDQIALSSRGCQIVAEQSGHVVAVDQPRVVVDAIRAAVDEARGQDGVASLCRSHVARVAPLSRTASQVRPEQ
jgi:pimeloyl-ACP methyl ester carboxylesterase